MSTESYGHEAWVGYDKPIQEYLERELALYGLFRRIAARLPYRDSAGTRLAKGVRRTVLYDPLTVDSGIRADSGVWQISLRKSQLECPPSPPVPAYTILQHYIRVEAIDPKALLFRDLGDSYRRPAWKVIDDEEDPIPAHPPRSLFTERHMLEPRQIACGQWLNVAAYQAGVMPSEIFLPPPEEMPAHGGPFGT